MERTPVSNAASHLWAMVVLVTAALSTTMVLAQSPATGQNATALHKQMMAEQKAAMAAVVNELVAQRKEMQEQMRMQGGMMERMMSHMGAMHGPPGSSPTLEQPKETVEPDHKGHHPDK